jgi:uncharacterized protein (DUF2267 family)
VQYDELIGRVAVPARLSEREAEALTRATLATLAERISGGEARDLAARLPAPLQEALLPAQGPAKAFTFEEFVHRVAERSRRDLTVSQMAVDAVIATLRVAVMPGEFDGVLSQLPKDFHELGTSRCKSGT